jgi:hypothetical protein
MKKSKSVFALSVAGATLASAIGFAGPAGAVNFVYGNVTYDVNTYTGSFTDLQTTLTASNNALWGNQSLSFGLADVVKGALGYPNDGSSVFTRIRGPYFAYDRYDGNFSSGYVGTYASEAMGGGQIFQNLFPQSNTATYATATAVPEPLTIMGSITATGFLAAFNRIRNKKEE